MKKMQFSNLADGAAEERMNAALTDVCDSFADPNLNPNRMRKITLVIKFVADEEREQVDTSVSCKVDLPPMEPHNTIAYLGKEPSGQLVLIQDDPKQRLLDFEVQAIDSTPGNVQPLRKEA